ncbi:arginine ABC transporter substrate-binding protein [Rodentibacter caecimuris]|uniref:Arginine ABC transporter substrate-binding protein n=1 Tax=Rodentibacter caecimuris TaxID=1796644 RepID=A0ABX3KXP7_9PAST|nr:arginine ABC transporter substrate-binding protein [Rodentibacter heylii]
MKKVFLTILLAGYAMIANGQTLTFAMEATYPPFESTNDKGEIVGFDVDIAKAICQQIQADCHFSNQAFDALIPSLKAKKFDAVISAVDITQAREKQVSFTEPYYDSTASFIAAKPDIDLSSVEVVGVQNGTTFQQYATKETKQYKVKAYASLQAAILDLKNGRIDMIFGDTAVLSEWMKEDQNVYFVGEKVTNKNYFGNGLGIAVNKSNKELLENLNKGLSAIKANGTYQEIYNKWMSGK